MFQVLEVTTREFSNIGTLRLRAQLSDTEFVRGGKRWLPVIASLELVEIDATVLDRAVSPSDRTWTRWRNSVWLALCS